MTKRSAKRTSWFITLPIAAGAVGYLWFVFLPTARTIRETRNEIRLKQDFISQAQSLHATLAQTQRDLKDVESYVADWDNRAPTVTHLPHLFGKIAHVAHEAGIAPAKFDPLKETTMETIRRAPVQMELLGGYEQIAALLAALERLPETIWIQQLNLEKQSETGGNVHCELKLEIFAGNSKKSD
jgi:Tfp pilus assembly protein PilO